MVREGAFQDTNDVSFFSDRGLEHRGLWYTLNLRCPIWKPLALVAAEHVRWDCWELKCAPSVKCTPDFSDLIQKNVKYIIQNFYIDYMLK